MSYEISEDVQKVHELMNTDEYDLVKQLVEILLVSRSNPINKRLLRRRLIIQLFIDES